MPKIVPIVEGHGDVSALPVLLRRILYECFQKYDWQIEKPIRSNGLSHFTNNVSRYLQYAFIKPGCDAVLLLFDLDDGCPREAALQLSQQIQQEYRLRPVVLVLAHREFETWFLASTESLAGRFDLPSGLRYEGEPEDRRDAKGWLTAQMPRGKIYKETFHQEEMAAQMDLGLAFTHSRSFRRLVHAVEEILNTPNTDFVSPIHP